MKMDTEVQLRDRKEGSTNDSRARDHGEKTTSKGECLIDMKDTSISRNEYDNSEDQAEKVCRICHFGRESSPSSSSKESELIQLGCDCKGELGSSHLHCAQTWFQVKGDRLCEICGNTAKNISSTNYNRRDPETSMTMLELNEMRMVAATLDSNDHANGSSKCCKKSFCNTLLACLVLAFLLSWFFRWVDIF